MNLRWAFAGVLTAIAVTTTMDATGLSVYSALPLLPLGALLWFLQRLPRTDVGVRLGRPVHYGLALLHPLIVIGVLTALVFAFGVAEPAANLWQSAGKRVLVGSLAGTLAVLLTEEGFFRGWLWGSLRRAGLSDVRVLVWSSIAFAAWHISAVTLPTGFNPPAAQVPVFLLNALVMGLIWGQLRWVSGSILVPSFCHAVWNAVAYSLYGFGTKVGALGVRNTSVFAPEVGILGLVLNVLFAAALYLLYRRPHLSTRASA
jgi:uncharacterized protein